jgi:adenylate cyclase
MSPVHGLAGAPLDLDAIRPCLEGSVPGVMATCGSDGMPNVTYVSQVEYVDARHLALSFQFFNKTRRNVLANPSVELLVVHPQHGAMYRITARYLRTETDGPLFARMKAKLAGIASHTGMSGVFSLRGADVYAVDRVEQLSAPRRPPALPVGSPLSALRRSSQRVSACADLDALVESLLDGLVEDFGLRHAMLLMADVPARRLYTVASRGYGRSGAGAEIAFDDGVIGVAAAMRTPIRINHATLEYSYGRAVREGAGGPPADRAIALPVLAEPGSQMALPLLAGGQVMGVLFVESPQELRFDWDLEDALMALAGQVAALVLAVQREGGADPEPTGAAALEGASPGDALRTGPAPAAPLRVRHYPADDSVFFDDEYLIKGVAGAVLWKLLREHAGSGRTAFTNRELRLAASELGLPEVGDNLEARLLLLTLRLCDRHAGVALEKTGRGRFRLRLERPVPLVDSPAG